MIVGVPVALGVSVNAHVELAGALEPTAASVHVPPPENVPAPVDDHETDPVGGVGVMTAVSVTVTWQLVGAATGSDEGVQITAVNVVSGSCVIVNAALAVLSE